MRAIMSVAHEVRVAAANTYGGRPGDYLMSIALEMAWEAHRAAKESKMVEITEGSAKQIAWAIKIREEKMSKANEKLDRMASKGKNKIKGHTLDEIRTYIEAFVSHKAAALATAWINTRDYDLIEQAIDLADGDFRSAFTGNF